jgi:hypothetical protein
MPLGRGVRERVGEAMGRNVIVGGKYYDANSAAAVL